MIALSFSEKTGMKNWLNSPEYERLKEANRREINRFPVDIDRSAFKKTPEEKLQLYIAKKEWKKRCR